MMPGNFPALHNMTQAEAFAWAMAPTPGIRITLTQGTPVTTADVTGATSIYAEPVNGGVVPLFQDAAGIYPCIRKLAPSTLSLALGTLASATIPNDVFAYNNNGAVGLEKLAWTNGTTRATAIDLVGGRYYKNGDYSRLYVGSFYPTATTTTEESLINRNVFNMYNRAARAAQKSATTNHTYNTNTERDWNASSTDTACNFMIGIVDQIVAICGFGQVGTLSSAVQPNCSIYVRLNGSTFLNTLGQLYNGGATGIVMSHYPWGKDFPAIGLNTAILRESDFTQGGPGYYQFGITNVQFSC